MEVWIPSAGVETLPQAVESVRRLGVDRIVVVDSSTNRHLDADLGDSAEVLNFPGERFNFARFVNMAVDRCRTDNLLLWNDDALNPSENLIEQFSAHLAGGASVVGCIITHPTTGLLQHAGIEFYGVHGLPKHLGKGSTIEDARAINGCRRVLAVTAAVMALRRDVVRELGGWDTNYANGYEDIDYCLRVSAARHPVIFCADATAAHHEALTRRKTITQEDRERQLARWYEKWNMKKVERLAIEVGDAYAISPMK